MTKDEIKQLCRLIPVGSTRFSVPATGDASAAQRWLDVEFHALNDPRFGFNFIRTLIETGTPFPLRAKKLDESLLEMAYVFERMAAQGQRPVDGAIADAHNLARPNNRLYHVVNALLMQPPEEYPYQKIAHTVGLSVLAIRVYETLYFNVRDRLDDPGYIYRLIWPHGRYDVYNPAYTSLVPQDQLLLQNCDEFGIEKGLAGVGFIRNYPKLVETAQGMTEIKHSLTAQCLGAMWSGQSNVNNRAIGRHMAFVIAEAQSGGPQSGALENVGMTNIGDAMLNELRTLSAVSDTTKVVIDITPEKQLPEKT